MPQMELAPFKNPGNAEIMNAIRSIATPDYQARVPEATKANERLAIEAMWDYSPARNQFSDALINLIGSQIVRYNTWTNPLSKFKQGLLNFGETIEEVAIGLLTAHVYNGDREYLERDIFGKEPNEVHSRFHKINRAEFYKLTVQREFLRRAFYSEGGLSKFVAGLMAQINTSDNWDEFLQMTSLFRIYYDNNGFHKVTTPNLSLPTTTANDAKQFLKQGRALAETLPFISRRYNAAKIPSSIQADQLELFITPEANANVDVEALSAAFNVDKAQFNSRKTVIPAEHVNVPGFQALLTSRDFFVVADNIMEMQNANNPVGLHTNYFWHHQETISASAFVPSILFTTEGGDDVIIVQTPVTGVSNVTFAKISDGSSTTSVARGDAVYVNAFATTNPAGGANSGVNLEVIGAQSTRTRINQSGVLFVGIDDAAQTLTIRATATDDESFSKDATITVTGALIEGSIGQTIDEDGNPATPNP